MEKPGLGRNMRQVVLQTLDRTMVSDKFKKNSRCAALVDLSWVCSFQATQTQNKTWSNMKETSCKRMKLHQTLDLNCGKILQQQLHFFGTTVESFYWRPPGLDVWLQGHSATHDPVLRYLFREHLLGAGSGQRRSPEYPLVICYNLLLNMVHL